MHNLLQLIGYSKGNNIFDHVERGTDLLPIFGTCRDKKETARVGDKEDRIRVCIGAKKGRGGGHALPIQPKGHVGRSTRGGIPLIRRATAEDQR